MPFLTLNGATVPVRSNALGQKYNEHRLDRDRMFDGTMRVIRQGVYRQWDVTTGLLSDAQADAILALVNGTSLPLSLSGDVTENIEVAVIPVPGSSTPVQTSQGFKRQLQFTLHETPAALPPDTSASVYAFFRRGVGYLKGEYGAGGDPTGLAAAGDGDLVSVWLDQSGNGFNLLGGINPNTLSYYDGWDPTRVGDELRFGIGNADGGGGPGGGGIRDGRSYLGRLSSVWWNALTHAEIMVCARATQAVPATSGKNYLWTLGRSGGGADGASEYPATTGHILEVACSSSQYDLGDTTADDLSSRHVYGLSIHLNADDPNWVGYLDNVVRASEKNVNPSFPFFDNNAPQFGIGGSGFFDGFYRDLVIFDAPLTATQRRSWYDYLRGAVSDPPLP